MKTPILAGLCAAVLLGPADASAEQQDKLSEVVTGEDAPDSIACAQESGDPLGRCTYGIERDGTGKTTFTAVFANGFKRRLYFDKARFIKGSTTMSGTGTDTDWNLEDGTHRIRVDDQRFEIPDTLIAVD